MFGNKEEKQNKKKAEKELNNFITKKGLMLVPTLKLRQILPLYGVVKINKRDMKCIKNINNTIKNEIKKGELSSEDIEGRIKNLLTQEYGEPISQEEANQKCLDHKLAPLIEKEKKLEEKFGIPFRGKKWFKCTIEEVKAGTITNTPQRQVDSAYVFIEEDYFNIVKESVFLKSKMGVKKIFFKNIASVDYDARGKLHISNSLVINLKSFDNIILKNLNEKCVKLVQEAFDNFMNSSSDETVVVKSDADELLKWHNLYEKGIISEEEFEAKKKELL